MEQKEKHFTLSWFFKWFLDNKAITVFLVTLLLGLNIFILSKISFLFFPVIDFLSVVMLPVILSGLLFYLLNPLVDLMEKYKINRVLAISIIFIIIAILLIIGLAVAIPNLQRQVVIFAQNVPSYLEESLLGPLKRLKVPVHEIGLMLSMSLRFVPTLMDDTIRIMNAQKARGVDFGEGNVIQKVKAMIPILIPLFATSLKRADSLATAMEARGYQGGNGRSQYRQLKWMNKDSVALLLICVLGGILFLLKS